MMGNERSDDLATRPSTASVDPASAVVAGPSSLAVEARVHAQQLRGAMRWLILVSALVFVDGVLGQAVPIAFFAALAAVIAGVAQSVFIGAVAAFLLAPIYLEDRNWIRQRLVHAWPYLFHATTWGLAAAGIGAVLAMALPQRLANVFSNSAMMPLPSWVALFFGGLGVAGTVLETAHDALDQSCPG